MVEATLSSTYSTPRVDDPTLQPPKKKRVHMFHDAITVCIPLEVTADLGVAIRRTRAKRIQALHEAFPSLNQKKKKNGADDDDNDDDNDDGESSNDKDGKEKGSDDAGKKQKADNNSNIPKPHEFASVLDYLEAKYVRGVMIQADSQPNKKKRKSSGEGEDSEEGAQRNKEDDDDDDEGEGSVYSQSSFLDDRDLQRDVAEQVLAQTTTTKMELEGDMNDDFFVNVGDLEVEETELTHQHYDPLDDSPTKKKPSVTKKRKKPSKDANEATTGAPKQKKKKEATGKAESPVKKKAATTTAAKTQVKKSPKPAEKEAKRSSKAVDKEANKSPKKKDGKEKAPEEKKKKAEPTKKKKKEESDNEEDDGDDDSDSSSQPMAEAVPNKPPKNKPKLSPEQLKKLQKTANKYKQVMEKVYQKIKTMIKEMPEDQLPRRRKQKSKVSITCPKNKKAGDMVTFDNPHIPGQRLRVNVPVGTFPGETFTVTVPVPKPAEPDDDTDHNKFDRNFQEILDEYARAYDEWCQHEGEYRHAMAGGDTSVFQVHIQKRNKFDKMVKEFPKNLMTPIDAEYMKKVVRRARQNKHKRLKTMAARRASGDGPKKEDGTDDEEESDEEEEEEKEPEPTHRTVVVPQCGRIFPSISHNELDFYAEGPLP